MPPPDPLATTLFCALLAGALGGILLRGRRRVAAALLGGALAALGTGLLLATPGWTGVAAALGALLGSAGPDFGRRRRTPRPGELGDERWRGGANVVVSEPW